VPELTIEPIFWDFSIATYRLDGAPEACLWLQNERGIDVNILLFCLWHGATRGDFHDNCLGEALRFSDSWRDAVVKPLRSARSWMKRVPDELENLATGQWHALREDIKACELGAEKTQETALERIANQYPTTTLTAAVAQQAASNNILRYCEAARVSLDSESKPRIELIQARAFSRLTYSP
jgi:uncharacterized protein (TIGR02444 family)